jgi:hypothetical protein
MRYVDIQGGYYYKDVFYFRMGGSYYKRFSLNGNRETITEVGYNENKPK